MDSTEGCTLLPEVDGRDHEPENLFVTLIVQSLFVWEGSVMKVIADLCVVPMGIGVSVSRQVALCERILTEAGLKTKLHAYGTNIEGEWDDVFAAVKRCHEALHADGVPRISTSMRFGTRVDREQHMEDKIRSVEEKLKPSY